MGSLSGEHTQAQLYCPRIREHVTPQTRFLQVEEVVALHSILGDGFELLSGLPADALADEFPDPAELAAAGPADGEQLQCRLRVFVDVPAGYRLQVWLFMQPDFHASLSVHKHIGSYTSFLLCVR